MAGIRDVCNRLIVERIAEGEKEGNMSTFESCESFLHYPAKNDGVKSCKYGRDTGSVDAQKLFIRRKHFMAYQKGSRTVSSLRRRGRSTISESVVDSRLFTIMLSFILNR